MNAGRLDRFVDLLRCPETGVALVFENGRLTTADGERAYQVLGNGICIFAENIVSPASKAQQAHYDRIAKAYFTNIGYPHTQEYMAYLDRELLDAVRDAKLGTVAEICCGRGEAIHLLKHEMDCAVGIDISFAMLEGARQAHPEEKFLFVQGDATALPLASGAFDNVFMLGGIHHVPDREALFSEVARVLKPGGLYHGAMLSQRDAQFGRGRPVAPLR